MNTNFLVLVHEASAGSSVSSMSFLVSVNLTWTECIATAKTPLLPPDQTWNSTQPIAVGHCDKGPLTYTISTDPASEFRSNHFSQSGSLM